MTVIPINERRAPSMVEEPSPGYTKQKMLDDADALDDSITNEIAHLCNERANLQDRAHDLSDKITALRSRLTTLRQLRLSIQ